MAFLDGGGKRAFDVWHRRAGKDLAAAHHACKQGHREVGAYWHFFPFFEQARRSIWEGYTKDGVRLLEQVFPGFLDPSRAGSIVKRKNEQQMVVELNSGSIWRLMGTDRVESVGAGPKGVVFSEFALCRPTAWDLVRPMLRESNGWAWFITTPRGRNHAKKLFDAAGEKGSGWHRSIQTVLDTGLTYASNRGDRMLTPAEMMDEERAEGMEEALIRQEYLCDWAAANVGAVWGDLVEQLEARQGVAAFEHPEDGVFTSWDLGFTDSTAIWFWRVGQGGGVDFIDHYESHGQPLSHYFDEIERRPYRYVKHWLPHDAQARTLAAGTSIEDQARQRFGPGAIAIAPKLSLLDGIQAGRWLLQKPTRIHSRCAEGIEALRSYRYEYDEDTKTFTRKPLHDWSSHTADAFRYAAVVARYSEQMTRAAAKPEKIKAVKPTPISLDDLYREHDLSRTPWERM